MDEFTLPESLADLAPGELDELETQAIAAFDTLYAEQGVAPSAEAVTRLTSYRDAIVTIRGERTARQTASQALQESVAAILAPLEEVAEAVAGETDAVSAAEAITAEAAAPEVVVVEDAQEPALVAAAPRPARTAPRIGDVARRSSRPEVAPAQVSRASLVAAADTGYAAGTSLSMSQVGEIGERRFGALPSAPGKGRVSAGIAIVQKPELPTELVASGQNDEDVLNYATDESRLAGGSLVAAGGWCAPSETWYDLAGGLESGDGLVNLPVVGAPRGGVRWTEGPQFCDFYSGTGFFTQTEAQADASLLKPTYEIGCPTFSEARLDAHGLSLSAGILTQRGYPEYIARFIAGSLTAHAHRVNAIKIQAMVAASTAVAVLGSHGATLDLLGAIELQVTDTRYKYRMAVGASLEMVAPLWLKAVVRSDIAHRNGMNELAVSDAQITAWFATRGVSVQFVYDWQDAMCSTVDAGVALIDTAKVPGGPTALTKWPATVDLLIYPAGTFVSLEQDVITLDAVYDAALFTKNRYQALFTEEALKVIKRAYTSRKVTVPLTVSGATGLQVAGSATTV